MRQAQGKTISLAGTTTANNGAPAGGKNLTSQLDNGVLRPAKSLLTIQVAGAVSDIRVWGRDNNKQVWGVIDGTTKLALAIGTYHIPLTNLGVYSDIYVESLNGVGATFPIVWLSNIQENSAMRGD